MRRGGGIGFLVVVIAAAIVVILTMRSWLSVAPTAKQIMKPGASPDPAAVSDHGDKEAGEALRSGKLPDLTEMKKATDKHAKEVGGALDDSGR